MGIKTKKVISLSYTEVRYISLSQSLLDLIPLMGPVKELRELEFEVFYKDNPGALELARLPKIHPCIKHINILSHHFRE